MIRKFFSRDRTIGDGPASGDAPFFEEPKSGAEAARAWVANTFGQIKGYGADKMEETAERLNGALPFIERAGFRVTEIEVLMGVTPALIPHVRVGNVLPKGERQALLDEIGDRKLTANIVKSLFRAADFGKRIDLKGFQFFEIEIEVGVIPSVRVKYEPLKRLTG